MRWLFLFAAAISLNGCGGKSSTPAPAVASCNEAFFGGEGLGSSSKAPEELVVETLQAMGELPLCSYGKRAGVAATYRVIVLPSFGRPRAARLWRRADGSWKASLTMLDGYESPKTVVKAERDVSKEAGRVPESLIAQYDPWRNHLRTLKLGVDGTVWIVEALTDRGYAVVAAWSPRDNLEKAARALLAAAGDDCGDCYPAST